MKNIEAMGFYAFFFLENYCQFGCQTIWESFYSVRFLVLYR